jgi:TIR domain
MPRPLEPLLAYLPNYRNDLFISYRRVSNQSYDGWVRSFCDGLAASLREQVGDVKLWLDCVDLRSGENWAPAIETAIDDAAIFLPIISGTYFEATECVREFNRFLTCRKDDPSRRLVPVFKQPPDDEAALPREVQQTQRHEFFRLESKDPLLFRELLPREGGDINAEYWTSLSRLAQYIKIDLKKLKGEAAQNLRGKVFVGRVGRELQAQVEALRADLRERGYQVVPEHEVLWASVDHPRLLEADLEGALLAIHPIARGATLHPQEAERERLQLETAHASMRRQGRPAPMVWMVDCDGEPDTPAVALIEDIETRLADDGIEYWSGGIEELKSQVYARLEPPVATQPQRVALLYDETEAEALTVLNARLVDTFGADPRPIKLAGAVPRDAQRMEATLGRCERAIVLWAGRDDFWLQDVLDLPALAGWQQRDRLAVCLAPPVTPEKLAFRRASVTTVDAGVGDAALRGFLAGPR